MLQTEQEKFNFTLNIKKNTINASKGPLNTFLKKKAF